MVKRGGGALALAPGLDAARPSARRVRGACARASGAGHRGWGAATVPRVGGGRVAWRPPHDRGDDSRPPAHSPAHPPARPDVPWGVGAGVTRRPRHGRSRGHAASSPIPHPPLSVRCPPRSQPSTAGRDAAPLGVGRPPGRRRPAVTPAAVSPPRPPMWGRPQQRRRFRGGVAPPPPWTHPRPRWAAAIGGRTLRWWGSGGGCGRGSSSAHRAAASLHSGCRRPRAARRLLDWRGRGRDGGWQRPAAPFSAWVDRRADAIALDARPTAAGGWWRRHLQMPPPH